MKNVVKTLKKILLGFLIVVLVLAFLGGVIWALDFTGVINFQKAAQKVPVVGKMIPAQEDAKASKKTPLQLENETLRADNKELQKKVKEVEKTIGDLEHKLNVAKEQNNKLTKEKETLKETVDSLQVWKKDQEGQKLSYEGLGRYYAEMKPEKAAKIMDNLDNEVTIGILLNLEDEQVSAILSAMEPAKAAEIVDLMRQ